MSVNKPGESTPTQSNAMSDAFARATSQSQNGNQNAGQQASGAAPSLRRGRVAASDINSTWRRPMSRRPTGEVVAGFVKQLNTYMEESVGANYRDNFSIHVLDNNTSAVPLSAILGCFSAKANGQDHIAVYAMIVEASGNKPAPRFININGQNVEIITTAGDVIDHVLWEKICTFLTETFGQQLNLHFAGAMVLPAELSDEDKDHLYRVAYTMSQAAYTVLEANVLGAEEPISISKIDTGSNLSAFLDYNPASVDTATGLPVRSDLSISLRSAFNTGGQISYEQVREITRVDGYIDLIWTEPAAPQYGPYGPQPVPTQRYTPRFVITRLDSEVDALTPELQLLGLSTTTLASRDQAWGGAFQSRYQPGKGRGVDLRDIGAIGWEVNLTGKPDATPENINTKSDSFNKASLFQLLSMAFHPGLVYSIDIEEAGELSWLHQVFIAAATGDKEATDAIITSANNLTDGQFARLWQGGALVHDDANRIHLGYYTDNEGNKRDLRDIDYLAMLNLLGAQDMQTVVNFTQTYDNTAIPLEVRLQERAKILQGVLNNVVIKGYARRVTFTPEFLNALAAACQNAGLVIRPANLFTVEGTGGRAGYNASAFAVQPQQLPGLFSYGQPGAAGAYRGIPSPFGRFR